MAHFFWLLPLLLLFLFLVRYIPDFGANPTVLSAQSGLWSNPATWNPPRVPQFGDVVQILNGNTVTYDVQGASSKSSSSSSSSPGPSAIKTVQVNVGGVLTFSTVVSTSLTVQNFVIKGELDIGTAASPIPQGLTATVIFPDAPFANPSTADPSQYGNGLLALDGCKIRIYGQPKTAFVRLAVDPPVGTTSLQLLTTPSNWKNGDALWIGDTHQPRNDIDGPASPPAYGVDQEEFPFLRADVGGSSSSSSSASSASPGVTALITLTPGQIVGTAFPHVGSQPLNETATGSKYRAHVTNQTRNVIFRSANPHGARGWFYAEKSADVDVQNAAFISLGRTKYIVTEDETTYQVDGTTVIAYSTNQAWRYGVTLWGLYGPSAIPASTYQWVFKGCVFYDENELDPTPPANKRVRIGFGSNGGWYGLFQNNILYNWCGSGAAFISPKQNDPGYNAWINKYNLIDGCYVWNVAGTGTRPIDSGIQAHQGNGIYLTCPGDTVSNCVFNMIRSWDQGAAQVYTYAVTIYNPAAETDYFLRPPSQGQPPTFSEDVTNNEVNTPMNWSNLEIYGNSYAGYQWWFVGSASTVLGPNTTPSLATNIVGWNLFAWHTFGYESYKLTMDRFIYRGDTTIPSPDTLWTTECIHFADYYNTALVVSNMDIRGCTLGFVCPTNMNGLLIIKDSYIECPALGNNGIGIHIFVQSTIAAGGYEDFPSRIPLPDRIIHINNCTVAASPNGGGTPYFCDLISGIGGSFGSGANLLCYDLVRVNNFQGGPNSYDVYYYQQRANAILPRNASSGLPEAIAGGWQPGGTTDPNYPAGGLQNDAALARFGQTTGGKIAPASAIDGVTLNPPIFGLIDSGASSSVSASPTPSFVPPAPASKASPSSLSTSSASLASSAPGPAASLSAASSSSSVSSLAPSSAVAPGPSPQPSPSSSLSSSPGSALSASPVGPAGAPSASSSSSSPPASSPVSFPPSSPSASSSPSSSLASSVAGPSLSPRASPSSPSSPSSVAGPSVGPSPPASPSVLSPSASSPLVSPSPGLSSVSSPFASSPSSLLSPSLSPSPSPSPSPSSSIAPFLALSSSSSSVSPPPSSSFSPIPAAPFRGAVIMDMLEFARLLMDRLDFTTRKRFMQDG